MMMKKLYIKYLLTYQFMSHDIINETIICQKFPFSPVACPLDLGHPIDVHYNSGTLCNSRKHKVKIISVKISVCMLLLRMHANHKCKSGVRTSIKVPRIEHFQISDHHSNKLLREGSLNMLFYLKTVF